MRKLMMACVLLLALALSSQAVLAKKTTSNQAIILLYHHIGDRTPPSTSTKLYTFLQHLDYLEKEGFEVWPLDRVAQHLRRKRPLPAKTAVLTFDSAYISVYEVALPYLKERNLPFTVFVNGEMIEKKHPLHLSWEQLKEMQAAGAIIANQGYSRLHQVRKFSTKDEFGNVIEETEEDWLARVEENITKNQQLLEQKLGKVPKLFAHPYGEFVPEIEQLVRKLGYVGFGQQAGPANTYGSLFALPRISASGSNAGLTGLRVKLESLALPVVASNPASGLLTGEDVRPNLDLTIASADYRISQLRCYGPEGQLLNVKAVQRGAQIHASISAKYQLKPGRPTYNCTVPHATQNRYYWHSFQWLLPTEDGKWPRR